MDAVVETQILGVSDPDAPPGRSLWTTPEMVNLERQWPMYSPQQVAMCFFGMSTAWLRKHLMLRHNVSEEFGVVEPPRRRTSSAHHYRLYDIERLAYALTEHHVLTPLRLSYALRMVRLSARMHGFLDEQEVMPVRLEVNETRRFLLMSLMGRLEQLEECPALPPSSSAQDDVLNAVASALANMETRMIEEQRLHEAEDDEDAHAAG
jgi:hypothetical protein